MDYDLPTEKHLLKKIGQTKLTTIILYLLQDNSEVIKQ